MVVLGEFGAVEAALRAGRGPLFGTPGGDADAVAQAEQGHAQEAHDLVEGGGVPGAVRVDDSRGDHGIAFWGAAFDGQAALVLDLVPAG